MGRQTTAGLIVIVVVLLFHFSGLLEEQPSGTGYVLNNLGLTNPANFGSTTFWGIIVGIGALGLVGIIIGATFLRSLEAALFLGIGISLIPVFIGIGWDLILIFNILRQTNNMFAVIVISPLLYAYGLTIYDWVRGRD